MTQPTVIDIFRIRYMKDEPLLQAGDSFPVHEILTAMETIQLEVAAKNLPMPIAIQQPTQ